VQTTRLWFLRHGEVEEHMVGTFIGTTDVGLSSLGRHQGEAIAKYLEDAPLDAILSSPRKRALDTIAPLARSKGMKLDVRKGLGEMHYGDWEGLQWNQIQSGWPDLAKSWAEDPATIPTPGGESCDIFYARVEAELNKILDEFKGRSIAIQAHAGTNRCILSHVLKRPFLDCMQFAQDYGCVNAVGWTPEGYGQVALVNFVPGPRAEKQGD
jgi:alpha-ribazole phosphatase